LIGLLLFCRPIEAEAWSPAGHTTIANLAWDGLSPEAKTALNELFFDNGRRLIPIKKDELNALFPETQQQIQDQHIQDLFPGERARTPVLNPFDLVTSLPDARKRKGTPDAEDHWVNIPFEQQKYDEHDKYKGRIIERLTEDIAALQSGLAEFYATQVQCNPKKQLTNEEEEKRKELRSLVERVVHFLADLHHPSHVTDNNDKGGSNRKVEYHGEVTDLHDLVNRHMLNEIPQWQFELAARIARVLNWRRGPIDKATVVRWTNQSHRLGRFVYRSLSGEKMRPGNDLVVRWRLAIQAGYGSVRIADVMNHSIKAAGKTNRGKAK
jgi:hypothetical protein